MNVFDLRYRIEKSQSKLLFFVMNVKKSVHMAENFNSPLKKSQPDEKLKTNKKTE